MNNKLNPQVRIGNSVVFINPGTGPVEGATVKNARSNMHAFLADCDASLHWSFRRVSKHDYDKDYGDGRFAFSVSCAEYPNKKVEIQMPGWELGRVRFMGEKGQNPFDFPRLYVDGGSWLWMYALLDSDYFEEE